MGGAGMCIGGGGWPLMSTARCGGWEVVSDNGGDASLREAADNDDASTAATSLSSLRWASSSAVMIVALDDSTNDDDDDGAPTWSPTFKAPEDRFAWSYEGGASSSATGGRVWEDICQKPKANGGLAAIRRTLPTKPKQ